MSRGGRGLKPRIKVGTLGEPAFYFRKRWRGSARLSQRVGKPHRGFPFFCFGTRFQTSYPPRQSLVNISITNFMLARILYF